MTSLRLEAALPCWNVVTYLTFNVLRIGSCWWAHQHDDCPMCKEVINTDQFQDATAERQPNNQPAIHQQAPQNNNGQGRNLELGRQMFASGSKSLSKKNMIDLLKVEGWLSRRVLSSGRQKRYSSFPWSVLLWREEAFENWKCPVGQPLQLLQRTFNRAAFQRISTSSGAVPVHSGFTSAKQVGQKVLHERRVRRSSTQLILGVLTEW